MKYYWSKFFKKLEGAAIINSKIDVSSKVEAGSNVIFSSMGKHSFCGYNCQITKTEIGSFTSIANNVVIGGGAHPMDWVSMSPVFYEGRDSVKKKYAEHKRSEMKRTYIGHDVWIGEKAIIKQGIKIGTGAVIGMGSVVTKDIDPYTVVGGVPAKKIKMRFSEKIIEELLATKWWLFEDVKLKKCAAYFKDPSEFLTELNK